MLVFIYLDFKVIISIICQGLVWLIFVLNFLKYAIITLIALGFMMNLELAFLLMTNEFALVIIEILSHAHLFMLIKKNFSFHSFYIHFFIVFVKPILVFVLYLLVIQDFSIPFIFIFVSIMQIFSFFHFK